MWIFIIIIIVLIVISIINSQNTQINYYGLKEDSKSEQFILEWKKLNAELKDSDLNRSLTIFIEEFYIKDSIIIEKFLANFYALDSNIPVYNEIVTESIKKIHYKPPGFSDFFIAAYPDVFLWVEKNWNSGNIEALEKLKKLSNEESEKFTNNPQKVLQFYRELINQFKNEKNTLECRQ